MPQGKIEDVLGRRTTVTTTEMAFMRMSGEAFFKRTCDRLEKLGENSYALRCVLISSPVKVETPGLGEQIKKVIEEGMHLAIVSPYPVADTQLPLECNSLNSYYNAAFTWACKSASTLRAAVALDAAADRIHAFMPKIPTGGAMLMPPNTRIAESRPILTLYRDEHIGDKVELGTYIHFLDGREDEWIETYGGEGPKTPRAEEALAIWLDYFGELIRSWRPDGKKKTARAHFELDKAMYWREAPLKSNVI